MTRRTWRYQVSARLSDAITRSPSSGAFCTPAGGCACHTPPDAKGLNAGGRKFEGPFGVVYSRNITPDPETGIGKWTDEQITNAIRRGDRADGGKLFPIHPYAFFANIADDDA